jgi:pimeloyl-ACP methyl ester carboxylesterase
MRRQVITVVAVTALFAVAAPPTPGSAAEVAPRPSAPVWGACPPLPPGVPPEARDPRQRCATIRVPLDYRRPHGRTIAVEISRIPTAKPGLKRGILLFNPGGPGGSGLDMPSWLGVFLPAEVQDRFDLIGFDPRGVSASTPVTCGLPADTPTDLILPYPAPDGSIDRNIAFARSTAERCAAHSGALQPHITTANTVRDMDQIRSVLGEPKLSYLGYSYGSYLGAVYTSLFPQRSDRIVLDSGVDPRLVWYEIWRTWGLAVALRLPDFTAWAAAHDATYHLGATQEAVTRLYYDLAGKLDRSPVTLPDGTVVNGNLFREVTRSNLYQDAAFPGLAEFWQFMASSTASGSPVAALAAAPVPGDNQIAALWSIVCNDVTWPRDAGTYRLNVTIDRRMYPATAGMPANIWPCAFWRYRPRQALGRRAAFVSVDQGGHGVYAFTDSACANGIGTAFLASGSLPAADRLCPGQSPPAAGVRTTIRRPALPGPLG